MVLVVGGGMQLLKAGECPVADANDLADEFGGLLQREF
jgi:hypothetical protein